MTDDSLATADNETEHTTHEMTTTTHPLLLYSVITAYSAYSNFENTNLKREQALIDILTDGFGKNSGCRPSTGLRKII